MSADLHASNTVGKVVQLTGNLANVARLATANLADDPQYFALQATRRFAGSRRLHGLRKLSAKAGGRAGFARTAALLGEDSAQLREILESQRNHWTKPRQAARLADSAIAAGLWQTAHAILDAGGSSSHTARTAARLHWSLGNLDEAVSTLDTAKGFGGRQLAHYRSELSVLNGWEPTIHTHPRDWSTSGQPRVLYVATNSLPYTGSGYAQRTHSLLTALQENGVEAWCATRVGYPLSIGHLAARKEELVQSVDYRRLLPARLCFDAAGRIQQQTELLAQLVTELRPSVLHTTTDFTNALAVRAVARAFDLPWVYEVRGQLIDTWASTRPAASGASQRYRLFAAREAELAASADAVLTLGEAMRENLQRTGTQPERITVLPNGVGEDYLRADLHDDDHARKSARIAVGLEPEAFYWGTVSSLVDYEGLDLLVRVTARLAPEHPKLRLLIVGDGVRREPLMRLAAELGVADRCRFPGRVPRQNAPTYHAALDVFAVPRRDLAVTRAVTPLKPVEAMASGVPVMASNLPALAELVKDRVNGLLIDPSDTGAWTESLEKLMVDPSLRSRLGRSGRKFVSENRTWSSCSSKLQRIYSSLAMAN